MKILKRKQWLIMLLFLSIITIICNNLVFQNTPEIINIGDELGEVLSRLSSAFIAAYIFYKINITLKVKEDRVVIYRTVGPLIEQLHLTQKMAFQNMISKSRVRYSSDERAGCSYQTFYDIWIKADNNAAEFDNTFKTFSFSLKEYKSSYEEVKEIASKIFTYFPLLEEKHIKLINSILEHKIPWSAYYDDGNNEFESKVIKPIYKYYKFGGELQQANFEAAKKYNYKLFHPFTVSFLEVPTNLKPHHP